MTSATITHQYDTRRDIRAPAKVTAHLLDLDAAQVAEWIRSGGGIVCAGLDWLRFTQEQHWHPSWAAAVARRYALLLSQSSAVDAPSVVQLYAAELAKLRQRRDEAWAIGDRRAASSLNGPILECMRVLSALHGINTGNDKASGPVGPVQVLVQAGGTVNLHEVGRLTDEQLRKRLAELEAEDEGEEAEAGDGGLGGGSPLVPSAAEAPSGSPPTPPSPVRSNHPAFDVFKPLPAVEDDDAPLPSSGRKGTHERART